LTRWASAFIVVQFGGRSVWRWKAGRQGAERVAKGPGGFDVWEIARKQAVGLELDDSTVSSYETGQEVKVITGVPSRRTSATMPSASAY